MQLSSHAPLAKLYENVSGAGRGPILLMQAISANLGIGLRRYNRDSNTRVSQTPALAGISSHICPETPPVLVLAQIYL